MLEYFKTILSKVSFHSELFEKELRKAIATLLSDEVKTLQDWCYQNFGNVYQKTLNRCFQQTLCLS